jgi:transporter family-2 protein
MTASLPLLPLGVSLLSGALVAVQAGFNPQLGRLLGHPLWASLVSFLIGTLALTAVICAMRVPAPAWPGTLGAAPWWLWLGGVFGAFYVTAAILYAPQLGATVFMAAVVVGQMLASLLLDHYALAGFAERPLSAWRLAGAVLLVAGLVMIQLSSAPRAPTSAGVPPVPVAPAAGEKQ